jgi:hypothetical protein
MNNTDKLIAAQYIVKQANIGALLGRLGGFLGKGLNFAKKNPLQAGALGAGGLGMTGLLHALTGRESPVAAPGNDSFLVNTVHKNPVLNKVVGTESIFAPGFFNRGMRPQQGYRGPEDFRPGLRPDARMR